ncbi:MAG: hypothetical protein QE271_14295 [Bacteriovoracaceae bacterium]|nr:hypothetical protein [Bacteriovoracaceae bacterium]
MSQILPIKDSNLTKSSTWLWLDSHVLSIKVAEVLSLGNGPKYYTWDPAQNFHHLVDTLSFNGVLIHDSKLENRDAVHREWMNHGLAPLLQKYLTLPVIIWGHGKEWDKNFWSEWQIDEARIFYWDQPNITPATFDNDRLALLNQNKFGQ